MANFNIKCLALKILSESGVCSGSAKCKTGEEYVLGVRTPRGMCASSFHSIYPIAFAMRCAEHIPLEQADGSVEVTCPGGSVIYKLSRMSKE